MRIITKMEQKYKYRGGDETHSTHSSHTQFLMVLSISFNSPLNLYLYTNEGEPHWSPPTFFHSLMGLVEWESHFHWVEKVGSPIGAHMGWTNKLFLVYSKCCRCLPQVLVAIVLVSSPSYSSSSTLYHQCFVLFVLFAFANMESLLGCP